MYLAKFLSHSGICSRRKAAIIIKSGEVRVNNLTTLNPAYVVVPSDVILVNGQKLRLSDAVEKQYVIFNKPAGLVTTTEDEFNRKTVIDYLVQNGAPGNIFPVGRLDYETTGLLLLTNDGDFANKMSHPKFEVTKCYSCRLDKSFRHADLMLLQKGIMLSDGFFKPDHVMILKSRKSDLVLITLHCGRNRIVRRVFGALGYNVMELERTAVGPFSLGTLKTGEWRVISEKIIKSKVSL